METRKHLGKALNAIADSACRCFLLNETAGNEETAGRHDASRERGD